MSARSMAVAFLSAARAVTGRSATLVTTLTDARSASVLPSVLIALKKHRIQMTRWWKCLLHSPGHAETAG